jgi:methionyl aminopeptidase
MAEPGVTTAGMNAAAESLISEAGAEALFKGVRVPKARFPFPAALCTSVNEEVVHGIPSDRALRLGDIISVDCGVRVRGYCGDSATTIPIGRIGAEVERLLEVTRKMLAIAIAEIRPGRRWSEIARKMQRFAEENRFSVVREFVGHGIGQEMHEDPKVPNYYDRRQVGQDFELRPGMTLAVEPMVNMGCADVEYKDEDAWTVVTRDGKWAAHYEHTIAVTQTGCSVLTDGR